LDALALGKANDVPDQQKVTRQARLADNLQFVAHLRLCSRQSLSGDPIRCIAHVKALRAELGQTVIGRLSLCTCVGRQGLPSEGDLNMAAIGDLERVGQSLRGTRKERSEFLRRL